MRSAVRSRHDSFQRLSDLKSREQHRNNTLFERLSTRVLSIRLQYRPTGQGGTDLYGELPEVGSDDLHEDGLRADEEENSAAVAFRRRRQDRQREQEEIRVQEDAGAG